MITKLAQAVHSDEFQMEREKELQRRIEDVHVQLEPFEEVRQLKVYRKSVSSAYGVSLQMNH